MAQCLNWDSWDLGIALISGGEGHAPSPTGEGTLTPFIPLSLRAFKVEGERKTEACTCANAQVHASSFGTGGGRRMDSGSGAGVTERGSGVGLKGDYVEGVGFGGD